MHGGYGIYYDRVTLEIESLERGLDGRALPIEVRAGNVFFLDPATGRFPPFAPSTANPFTGFILPGAGASGINIIDNGLREPDGAAVQPRAFSSSCRKGMVLRADGVHNLGTHFIIGRTIGEVFNPGGRRARPRREPRIERATRTTTRCSSAPSGAARSFGFRASYTLAKAFNYANDDQIPFAKRPDRSERPRLRVRPDAERSAPPLHVRRRGSRRPAGFVVAPILTLASGVPMDILMPDGQSRVPAFAAQRRRTHVQDRRGVEPRADVDQRQRAASPASCCRSSATTRVRRRLQRRRSARVAPVHAGGRARIEPIVEVFNLFNVTNILGVGVT